MLSVRSLWSMRHTYRSRRANTEYTESHRFRGGVFLLQSNHKVHAKSTKTGSDTGSVTLTRDTIRPGKNRWPVIWRPGSNTAVHCYIMILVFTKGRQKFVFAFGAENGLFGHFRPFSILHPSVCPSISPSICLCLSVCLSVPMFWFQCW